MPIKDSVQTADAQADLILWWMHMPNCAFSCIPAQIIFVSSLGLVNVLFANWIIGPECHDLESKGLLSNIMDKFLFTQLFIFFESFFKKEL